MNDEKPSVSISRPVKSSPINALLTNLLLFYSSSRASESWLMKFKSNNYNSIGKWTEKTNSSKCVLSWHSVFVLTWTEIDARSTNLMSISDSWKVPIKSDGATE